MIGQLLAWQMVQLPLDDPIYVFTLALAAFLFGPLLIKRLGQPGIVGIVLLGVVIGPNGVGLIEHTDAIVLLGSVGLVYLLFTVGLELDLRGFAQAPENAALFGLTSFFLPLIAGTYICITILGFDFWPALLLSAVFASHTLLAYPVVNRYDITKNKAVTAVFGGILFTDTIALTILAIVLGTVEGAVSIWLLLQIFIAIGILFLSIWAFIPPIARWFFNNLSDESYFEFLFVLVVVFAGASLAELLGIDAILGAFVAGLAFNRLITRGGTLMNRIEFVGNAFFIPFFLLHVGMLVDLNVILEGFRTLEVTIAIVGTMVIAKGAAAWLVSQLLSLNSAERGVMFGLSTGQAAAALAITLLGYEAGLFTAHVLNAVVLMLLITAIISPWVTERYSKQLAMSEEVDLKEEAVVDPRILIPFAPESRHGRELLEFGFALKERFGTNPVFLLSVIPPQWRGQTEEHIAEVEKELEDIGQFADAAEVPVRIETRLNYNVASGIIRGTTETRADLLIIGWNPTRTVGDQLFGNIIDQVLRGTTLPVFVTHFGHPVNTTEQLTLFLPPGIDHHEGFYEGVYISKLMADKLGIRLSIVTFEDNLKQYQQLFEFVEIDIDAEFHSVSSWTHLHEALENTTGQNDLVMALSAREGEVGWHPQLKELPNHLIDLPAHSFVVLYLREDEPEYDAKFLRIT